MPLPRWIVRGLACAALLAAIAPAWAAAIHLISGQWRTDLCEGGSRTALIAHHDCCLGSADPALPEAGCVLRLDAPAPEPQPVGAAADRADPPFTRALTRAPPGLR